jgi:hypothetical protein
MPVRHASDAYKSTEFSEDDRLHMILDDFVEHLINRTQFIERTREVLCPGQDFTETDIEQGVEEDMVEMKAKNADILHFCGRKPPESEKCPIFLDLKKKYEDNGWKCPFKLGDYIAKRYPDGLIEYTPRKVENAE